MLAFERRLGVRASAGGRHVGRGTHNALLALGPNCYLEILATDRTQPASPGGGWLGVDRVHEPRLVTWAARRGALEALRERALARGVPIGAVRGGNRTRADGVELHWRLTEPDLAGDGLVPFFIDWGDTPHPSATAASGITLTGLRAEHPDPARLAAWLDAVDVPLAVARARAPALIATLQTPLGVVELR